jgi:pimeloyl-ACP methyl ester carboxylesterase
MAGVMASGPRRTLAALAPGSRLVTMERAGHMAHLEEPAAFAATVAAFLRD